MTMEHGDEEGATEQSRKERALVADMISELLPAEVFGSEGCKISVVCRGEGDAPIPALTPNAAHVLRETALVDI